MLLARNYWPMFRAWDSSLRRRLLYRPGRDPRKEFEAFSFAPGIEKLEDLQVGMKLPGIVTNVTAFGAFVDISVHQDGLCISADFGMDM